MARKDTQKGSKPDSAKRDEMWACASCSCKDNWITRSACRACGAEKPKDQKSGKGRGPAKPGKHEKTTQLLSQVVQQQQRMQDAIMKLTAPKPTPPLERADMAVDKEGDEEGAVDVAERMKALQVEIEKLKSVLGDSDPAVTTRQCQLEELAKQRPLASQMLYTQRKLRKVEKKEQELIALIRASEQELVAAQEKINTANEDLKKLRLEKDSLLCKQRGEQPQVQAQVTLPHAMQILAELVNQMGQLKPEKKDAWETMGREMFEVFSLPPVNQAPAPAASASTAPPLVLPLPVLPQGFVPPPPPPGSKGGVCKGESRVGTGKGTGDEQREIAATQVEPSERSRSGQRRQSMEADETRMGRGRSLG
eukprot:6466689-Amphidinium_carterae.1